MIPENPPRKSNAREARMLLRAHRYGALSTLSRKFEGHPFGSITPYLTDHDGSLLILISDLAEHTRNIKQDARVSLITHDQNDPHIQTQGRVTVVGSASHVAERDTAGTRYLRYFPEAETYFAMHDFQFYRIVPQAIRYIGGFGDIHWVKAENYIVSSYPLIAEEQHLLDQLNANCTAEQAGLIGVDCDGYDIMLAKKVTRFNFSEPIHTGAAAQACITL